VAGNCARRRAWPSCLCATHLARGDDEIDERADVLISGEGVDEQARRTVRPSSSVVVRKLSPLS
jgi:hypothetical protein